VLPLVLPQIGAGFHDSFVDESSGRAVPERRRGRANAAEQGNSWAMNRRGTASGTCELLAMLREGNDRRCSARKYHRPRRPWRRGREAFLLEMPLQESVPVVDVVEAVAQCDAFLNIPFLHPVRC